MLQFAITQILITRLSEFYYQKTIQPKFLAFFGTQDYQYPVQWHVGFRSNRIIIYLLQQTVLLVWTQ